jgi:hypothetical protein
MIRVLYFRGCPNHEPAVQMAREVASRTMPRVEVEAVEITAPRQAVDLSFCGSPTIQVDGVDIEPGIQDAKPIELACRVYQTDNGILGLPPIEWLEEALRAKEISVSTEA